MAKTPVTKRSFVKKPENEIQKEEKQFNPVVSENREEEKLTAQAESDPEMMKPVNEEQASVQKKEEEKTPDTRTASASKAKNTDDEYQSIAIVASKKVRALLGIKKTSVCENEDEKLGWWDLALAAKQGVQKLTGAKSLDVKKVCDGTGETVEYFFAAGNFEITKNASK